MQSGWGDPALRHRASLGAFSGVLVHLLDSDQVDGVVQIMADPEAPMGNVTNFAHCVGGAACLWIALCAVLTTGRDCAVAVVDRAVRLCRQALRCGCFARVRDT